MTKVLLTVLLAAPLVFAAEPAKPSADQLPYWFKVSAVKAGEQMTLMVDVQSKWSYANDSNGDYGADLKSTEIHCYQHFGICEDADAFNNATTHKAFVGLAKFDILRWNEHELVAENSSVPCMISTLRFDFDKHRVTLNISLTGDRSKFCEAVEKGTGKITASTAFLTGYAELLK